MEKHRFAGYGIVEFTPSTKEALREIAEILIPHQEEVLQAWVKEQWNTWQPPGISHEELAGTFRHLYFNMLSRMHHGELEECLTDLETSGRQLAQRNFPFQSLIVSIHYLEESYLPHLLRQEPDRTLQRLIGMDEFLHSALAAMAGSYFEEYRRDLLDEAEVGRIVQEGLLADIPKKTQDLEIAHVYVSARERAQLGGDFLDLFSVGPEGVAFIIGDLSGHGLEAAADSVMLRSLFRGFMREDPDIARAMERTNKVLVAELQQDQFATALAAIYDTSGRLHLVSAGHPQPIACLDSCDVLDVLGDALGIREEANYKVDTFPMPPGATFVAYTDGLTEAGSGPNRFGEAGALHAVNAMHGASARAIAEHLVDSALRYAGGKFSDDVAVLVLRRRDTNR